jgi:hypothetical protein
MKPLLTAAALALLSTKHPMKTLTTLALVLSLSPAHGAALRSPRDIPDIIKWSAAYGTCIYSTDEVSVAKACHTLDVLSKKMEARGYCMVLGRGSRSMSNDRGHYYRIENKQLDKAYEAHEKAIEEALRREGK